MKILFLGSSDSPLIQFFRSFNEEIIVTSEMISPLFMDIHSPEFLVSYGYRHIIKRDILNRFDGRAINLHISLLPWNKGVDPNFWSFVENTPKGVTIHALDEGVDTGDILLQKSVVFGPHETLRSSYDKLHQEIQTLFMNHWANLRSGKCPRTPQQGPGSVHRSKDKEKLMHLLIQGWDTPVSVLEKYALSGLLPSPL